MILKPQKMWKDIGGWFYCDHEAYSIGPFDDEAKLYEHYAKYLKDIVTEQKINCPTCEE